MPEVAEEGKEKQIGEIASTLPAEAKAFVACTGVDRLAVSIGTVHRLNWGTPKLDFTR